MTTEQNYAEPGLISRLQLRYENGKRIRTEEPSYEEALEEIRSLEDYEVEWLYSDHGRTRGEGPASVVSDNIEEQLSRADEVDVFVDVREEGTLLSFASVSTKTVLSGEPEREEGRRNAYVGVEDRELF